MANPTWGQRRELTNVVIRAKDQFASDNVPAFLSSIRILVSAVEGLERDRTNYLSQVKLALIKLKTLMVQVQEDKKKSAVTFREAIDILEYLDEYQDK